jgi:hypothetical protein
MVLEKCLLLDTSSFFFLDCGPAEVYMYLLGKPFAYTVIVYT